MKKLIVAAAILFSVNATAADKVMCDSFATITKSVGEQRDIGLSKSTIYMGLLEITSKQNTSKETKKILNTTAFNATEIAFALTEKSPEELYTWTYDECVKH